MSEHRRLLEESMASEFACTFLADPILVIGAKAVLRNAPTASAVFIDDIQIYLRKKLAECDASGEWRQQSANVWGRSFILGCLDELKALEEKQCADQKIAEMIVTHTTEDFSDAKVAKARGWYRKHYFCPKCNLEIAHETYEQNHMFGSGSVLANNMMPQFCPECGTRIKKPAPLEEAE